jgi:hypothetical protein
MWKVWAHRPQAKVDARFRSTHSARCAPHARCGSGSHPFLTRQKRGCDNAPQAPAAPEEAKRRTWCLLKRFDEVADKVRDEVCYLEVQAGKCSLQGRQDAGAPGRCWGMLTLHEPARCRRSRRWRCKTLQGTLPIWCMRRRLANWRRDARL